ncbi:MAG: MFS transporter [Candidatus Korobacteraceae bacterium]|jgi:MFS family permease
MTTIPEQGTALATPVSVVPWYKEIDRQQWKALVAAGLGYGLEAMDIMLYAMVIVQIMKDLRLTSAMAGVLASLSLFSAAFGGFVFGIIADKWGRTKSMIASILMYSAFTAACGFSQTVVQLAVCRILLGIGVGGEYTAGAALVTESWPPQHRGKAMGLVQANFGIGYALAAVVAMVVLPRFGWRAVFFVGVLPALLTYFVRRSVKEPEIWKRNAQQSRAKGEELSTFAVVAKLFSRGQARHTLIATSLCSFLLFAYWGAFTWIPGYLAMPVAKGGAGLSMVKSLTWVFIMQFGGVCGHLSFGYISDKLGRRLSSVIFYIMSGVLTVAFAMIRDPTMLLVIGPFLAYFGYGYYAGLGPILAELYPSSVRATGIGFCYNVGRGVSAFAPAAIGFLALSYGIGGGIAITAVAYVLACGVVLMLPETKGKVLD